MDEELGVSVRIGDVLAAKYRVDRVLGAGGMGVVVAATHLQLDQMVALKFIRAEALLNPEIVSRFEREARAAVRLKSEHVARIIDVGRLDTGSPFIVMEYLEGQDLAQLLEQCGAMPVAAACDYVIQALDAIAEAHSLGIVHRDLKPGNLFLATTSHGHQKIKVLDFGISKSQGPGADPSMTRTQAVMGSPGYMSPEQMRSTKNVDGRSDLWSLGIILYELVAGRVPFQADTFSALCVKIAVDPHPPMPGLPSTLPAGFEAVVDRALEKNPALRYQSAAELAQALAPYAGAQARDRAQRLVVATPGAIPSAAHPVLLSPTANTLDAAAGQARVGPPQRARSSRSRIVAGAGLAAAAVVAIVLGTAFGGRSATSRARPTATEQRVESPRVAPVTTEPKSPPPAVLDAGPAPPPPAMAPIAAPPLAERDAGVAAPVVSAPHGKPRTRSATPDTPYNPYNSPD